MPGTDTKSGWNSGVPKARFGGGMALKFGGGFRPVTNLTPNNDIDKLSNLPN